MGSPNIDLLFAHGGPVQACLRLLDNRGDRVSINRILREIHLLVKGEVTEEQTYRWLASFAREDEPVG